MGDSSHPRIGWPVVGATATVILAAVGVGGMLGAAPGPTTVRIPVTEVATSTTVVPAAATTADSAPQPTPDQQRLLDKIPAGFTCQPASDPPPPSGTLAALDCYNNSLQAGARYLLFPNANALNSNFKGFASGDSTIQQCPDGSTGPESWHANADPNVPVGQIFCDSWQNQPEIVYTKTADLLQATVGGGPDLNSLWQWWQNNA
jgi:serine/threonine kinase PknH